MFDEFVSSNGTTAANYEWSGYVLEVLLPYLEENRHIDLMKGGGFDEISARLSAARQATHEGIQCIHRSLLVIDEDNVVLLSIG